MGKKLPPPPPFFEQSVVDAWGMPPWLSEIDTLEATVFCMFLVLFVTVRWYGTVISMKKRAILDMHALNRVNVFKECFLAYVNAGMLEPILAIASSEYDISTKALVINLLQLGGLFSWVYLLSDAFDISDTQQAFVYWDRVSKRGSVTAFPVWYKPSPTMASKESREVTGSLFRDLALWLQLASIFAAFSGLVSHRDVIHSHAVCILWVILHHLSRRATSWRGTGYLHTLFAPSTALLPLEYCLNLIDQEMVGDEGLDDLAAWRDFIKMEAGVELTLVL